MDKQNLQSWSKEEAEEMASTHPTPKRSPKLVRAQAKKASIDKLAKVVTDWGLGSLVEAMADSQDARKKRRRSPAKKKVEAKKQKVEPVHHMIKVQVYNEAPASLHNSGEWTYYVDVDEEQPMSPQAEMAALKKEGVSILSPHKVGDVWFNEQAVIS